jgi:hypothetical protein
VHGEVSWENGITGRAVRGRRANVDRAVMRAAPEFRCSGGLQVEPAPEWNACKKLENVWQVKDLQTRFLDVARKGLTGGLACQQA